MEYFRVELTTDYRAAVTPPTYSITPPEEIIPLKGRVLLKIPGQNIAGVERIFFFHVW